LPVGVLIGPQDRAAQRHRLPPAFQSDPHGRRGKDNYHYDDLASAHCSP
jgi:hypothetical protein